MSDNTRPLMIENFPEILCQEGSHQPYKNYLPERIRSVIEQRYYSQIDNRGRLEQLLSDTSFSTSPHGHCALFADHGVAHARDIARQILQVIDCINGVLIPPRDMKRLEFMKGYGVQLAYLHDVGLCNLSAFGRLMHAYIVAQKVMSPEFDDLIQAIWEENAGNIRRELTNLSSLKQDPKLVLREMLALAVCHSKSAIPVEVLCDPQLLRKAMLHCASIDLQALYNRLIETNPNNALSTPPVRGACPLVSGEHNGVGFAERLEILHQYYGDFFEEGFRWLIRKQPSISELVHDVTDTLRALRCADALRQRGTTLKTSGNYEIFVDRKSGNAIFALRQRNQKLILVEIPDPISAGEANLASCELTKDGDLRASFHRGGFVDPESVKRAASNAAWVLIDILGDVVESFERQTPSRDSEKSWRKDADEMQILLENVSDNIEFATLVKSQVLDTLISMQNPIRVVPSLKDVSVNERNLYLKAKDLDWDEITKRTVLDRIAKSGYKTGPIDLNLAFRDVKSVKIAAGSTLINAGDPPGFVYVPLNGRLKVIPLGDYPSILIQPWMLIGITSVIRGSERNATVIAEDDLDLLMIPQEVYLQHWHHTYDINEFIQWMEEEKTRQAGEV